MGVCESTSALSGLRGWLSLNNGWRKECAHTYMYRRLVSVCVHGGNVRVLHAHTYTLISVLIGSEFVNLRERIARMCVRAHAFVCATARMCQGWDRQQPSNSRPGCDSRVAASGKCACARISGCVTHACKLVDNDGDDRLVGRRTFVSCVRALN